MLPHFGPVELGLILVIVIMLFGVGKLPEVFGSVGKGIREFRRNASDPSDSKGVVSTEQTPPAKAETTSDLKTDEKVNVSHSPPL
jgi:sec-independent protein translocase protein TatA